jgi:2-hydroxymuconate-semialdehyde hydrolase
VAEVRHRFVLVDGIRTHYLEAGEGPELLLLHSGEFGGCAEICWEYNIGPLSEHFHVVAPDLLGFGQTDKVFDFAGQFDRRIRHISRFLQALGIERTHVAGSSMAGGITLAVAARENPDWPLDRIVISSGGGYAPDNEHRKVLNSYDGTFEHMRKIVRVMFHDPRWSEDDAYVRRRHESSLVPGAWECTAAARFRAPFRESARRERDAIDYGAIKSPALIMAGRHDPLRLPGYADELAQQIPNAELHIFESASHMGHIECSEEFNEYALRFFKHN